MSCKFIFFIIKCPYVNCERIIFLYFLKMQEKQYTFTWTLIKFIVYNNVLDASSVILFSLWSNSLNYYSYIAGEGIKVSDRKWLVELLVLRLDLSESKAFASVKSQLQCLYASGVSLKTKNKKDLVKLGITELWTQPRRQDILKTDLETED